MKNNTIKTLVGDDSVRENITPNMKEALQKNQNLKISSKENLIDALNKNSITDNETTRPNTDD